MSTSPVTPQPDAFQPGPVVVQFPHPADSTVPGARVSFPDAETAHAHSQSVWDELKNAYETNVAPSLGSAWDEIKDQAQALPKGFAKPTSDSPSDEQHVGLLGPLSLATYRMGKQVLSGLAAGKTARDQAAAEGQGLAGQTLSTIEQYPMVGDIVRMMEQGNVAPAIAKGLTRAALLKGTADLTHAAVTKGVSALSPAEVTPVPPARSASEIASQTPKPASVEAVPVAKEIPSIDLTPELKKYDQQTQLARQGVRGGSEASVPTFFSKLERVAADKVPNSASGDQILATLRNNGVKENEIGWTGVDDFLKGKAKVSKADLQGYINEHKIGLGEVDLGKNADQLKAIQKERDAAYAENNKIWQQIGGGTPFTDLINAMNEQRDLTPIIAKMPEEMQGQARRFVETDQAIHAADDKIKQLGSKNWMPTKFEQYTLPGEKSGYQEKLLTLPDITQNKIDDLNAQLGEMANRPSTEHAQHPEWKEQWDDLQNRKATLRAQQAEPFKSSHFPEDPNILAHVRYDERPALDGKKTLFLEEVQSDWHQKGKQEGYNDPNRRTALENQISDLGKRRQEIENKGADATEQEKQEWADIKNTLVGLKRTFNASHKGVPDAPFKSDWHELALKRMLRHAAENGYDRMAWTTGEQQAARYDLSKQISEVSYNPDTGYLLAKDHNGRSVINEPVEPEEFADYIGKEPAAKLTKEIENHVKSVAYDRSQWSVEPEKKDFSPRPEDEISQEKAKNALSWDHKVTMGMPAEFGYNYTTIDNPNQLEYAPKGAKFYSGSKGGYVIRDPNGDLRDADVFPTKKAAEDYIDLTLLRDREAQGDILPKLSGLDLKVGGEWAKNLYDRAIPNFLNKYTKKWGAKVSTSDISTGTNTDRIFAGAQPSDTAIKEMWRTSHGTLHTSVNNVISAMQEGKSFSQAMDSYGTEELAERLGGKMQYGKPRTEKVHSIEITPAMKKDVLQLGQPISKKTAEPSWKNAVMSLAV